MALSRVRRLTVLSAVLLTLVAAFLVLTSNTPDAHALNGSTGNINVSVTPTTGLSDGQNITVSATTTNSALLYEIKAHICAPGANITDTFNFSYSGPYCVATSGQTGSLGTGSYEVTTTLAGVSNGGLTFKAGIGTVEWDDFSPIGSAHHSLPCGQGHPCDLVLQFQATGGTFFFTAPLSYGTDTTTTSSSTSSSTSSTSTSSTSTTLPTSSPFSDVPTDSPLYAHIIWLVGQGITTGYPDGTFRPANPVTRQAMAAFLYRYAGKPNGEHPTCSAAAFSDVPKDSQFCGEITWLVSTGVTTGYGDGTFKPGAPVTRQAMAAFLYRFAGKPLGSSPTCSTPPFSDVPAAMTFCGEITWLVSTGVATGYGDGTFKPGAAVSRQAMAAFLHRLHDLPH